MLGKSGDSLRAVSWFSAFITWLLSIDLRLSGLVACAVTSNPSHQPPVFIFKTGFHSIDQTGLE